MKIRTLAALGAGLALAIGATAAQAAVQIVSVQQNVLMGAGFTSKYITFNGFATKPPTPGNFATGGVAFSGSGFVVSGNAAGEYQMPTNDFSPYFALGTSTKALTRTETLTFTKGAVSKFGLYWGSIDTYNKITFLLNGAPVGTITGTNVANFSSTDGIKIQTANGPGKNINTNASAYVDIYGVGNQKFNSVVLQTTQPNFELDNVAVGSVPEASTWAMMLLGLGGLGAVTLYRRRNTTATLIAA